MNSFDLIQLCQILYYTHINLAQTHYFVLYPHKSCTNTLHLGILIKKVGKYGPRFFLVLQGPSPIIKHNKTHQSADARSHSP